MKIAIAYWGLTRSTKNIYQSHYDHLHQIFNENNIEYTIFLHSWVTHTNHGFIWETFYEIDNQEYQFLLPHEYKIENQDEFLHHVIEPSFSLFYRPPEYEWSPQLIQNHLCALESQKRVTNMIYEHGNEFDFVMYIRPDVWLSEPFPIHVLTKDWSSHTIGLLNYDHFEGYNDKFAIVPWKTAGYYGKRIDDIIEFRQTNGRIVSEKFVKYIVHKYFQNIQFLSFPMKIVRPCE